jgi:hypothetical protein
MSLSNSYCQLVRILLVVMSRNTIEKPFVTSAGHAVDRERFIGFILPLEDITLEIVRITVSRRCSHGHHFCAVVGAV